MNPIADGFYPIGDGFNPIADGFYPTGDGFNPIADGFYPIAGWLLSHRAWRESHGDAVVRAARAEA